LGDERVDRIEFQFVSKMSDELHSEFLSVKVSVEVDEVCLEQRGISEFIERGTATKRNGTRPIDAIGRPTPTGVDAIGRKTDRFRDRKICRTESEVACPAITMTHNTAHLVGATQHRICRVEIATAQGGADSRRRHGLIRRMPVQVNEFVSQCLETKIAAHLDEEFHVPGALIAKVEIAPDSYQLCVERSDEISRNELGRRFMRTLFIEAHNEYGIDTTLRK
jgi:hypothetical protein